MKKLFTFLFLALFTLGVNAQLAITFEGPNTAAWEVFGNGAIGATEFGIVANPLKSGINTSDSVLKFNVAADAQTWAGAWSDNFGPFTFTEASHIVTMMVNKSVISNCAIKLEGGGFADLIIYTPNTVTGEWEKLSFDLSAAIGLAYPRLTMFPEFPDTRTAGSTNYFDNIMQIDPTAVRPVSEAKVRVYPNPASDVVSVQQSGMTGLTISNLLGKQLKSYKFSATESKSVELDGLSAGIYMISVETANGIHTTKFVKR